MSNTIVQSGRAPSCVLSRRVLRFNHSKSFDMIFVENGRVLGVVFHLKLIPYVATRNVKRIIVISITSYLFTLISGINGRYLYVL